MHYFSLKSFLTTSVLIQHATYKCKVKDLHGVHVKEFRTFSTTDIENYATINKAYIIPYTDKPKYFLKKRQLYKIKYNEKYTNIFALICEDGKQDRMLMATAMINRRINHITSEY